MSQDDRVYSQHSTQSYGECCLLLTEICLWVNIKFKWEGEKWALFEAFQKKNSQKSTSFYDNCPSLYSICVVTKISSWGLWQDTLHHKKKRQKFKRKNQLCSRRSSQRDSYRLRHRLRGQRENITAWNKHHRRSQGRNLPPKTLSVEKQARSPIPQAVRQCGLTLPSRVPTDIRLGLCSTGGFSLMLFSLSSSTCSCGTPLTPDTHGRPQ